MILHLKKEIINELEKLIILDKPLKAFSNLKTPEKIDFSVGVELHERSNKSTDNFKSILFLHCYGNSEENVALVMKLVYDALHRKKLLNNHIETSLIKYESTMGDVEYIDKIDLYMNILTFKVNYKRKAII